MLDFELQELPSHLAIIGGGPIGIEMAQAFRRLGSDVTILEAGKSILGKDDPELVDVVRQRLIKEGIAVLEDVKINKISQEKQNIDIDISSEILSLSHVLIATGRAPVVDGIGLDIANVDYDRTGIKVDAAMRTSNPKIFAVGDVVGPYQFTHMAGYQAGLVISRSLFGNILTKANYTANSILLKPLIIINRGNKWLHFIEIGKNILMN